MAFRPAFADLSHHNSIADSAWSQATGAGLVGVILKCTEGTSYLDDTYAARVPKAKAAGLLVASYHFLKASSAPEDQMDWYLANAQAGAGERLVIDFEDEGLTFDFLLRATSRLFDRAPMCEVSIYSGQSFINQICGTKTSDVLARTSLWVARYTAASDPGDLPTQIWPTWTAWQYTDGSSGGDPKTVPGFGKCDLNAFNGSPENCAKWFCTEAAPAPGPEPEPEPEPAEITITTKGAVRVIVNGQVVTYE